MGHFSNCNTFGRSGIILLVFYTNGNLAKLGTLLNGTLQASPMGVACSEVLLYVWSTINCVNQETTFTSSVRTRETDQRTMS